ncbi:RNA polymerase sigma-I factor [Oscillospiraceae bacterium PP1C4]
MKCKIIRGGGVLRELDRMAVQAAVDEQKLDYFIEQSQSFILKCASHFTHRYITKSDDEWSLALIAFTQAIKTYDLSKGSFYNFAELVIQRRLTDYYRTQSKYTAEIAVNPEVFDTDMHDDDNLSVSTAILDQVYKMTNYSIKDEIDAANQAFSHYGFSFFDLADCSPKAEKTKSACAKAAAYLLKNPLLVNELYSSKLLPIKIIEKNAKVPRKILERHRKYIIAAVEILSGEYPCLADYMQFIRKELNK